MRHGDDIGAQRITMNPRDGVEGVEHFADLAGRVEIRGNQRSRVLQLAQKELDPAVLVPSGVRAESKGASERVERCGVSLRFLTDVQSGEHDAKDGRAAKQIGETSLGDDPVSGGDERLVTETQGLGDRLRVEAGARRGGDVASMLE